MGSLATMREADRGYQMKYESWGIFPHWTNGEMLAITIMALIGLWLAIGLLEKRDRNNDDFN